MIQDLIYKGYRFKKETLQDNETLLIMFKENVVVQQMVVPNEINIYDYIDAYLKRFAMQPNTTRYLNGR